jgi:tRNA pseudouridine synthase 10
MEFVERVKEILEKYDICDECLGRQFHSIVPKIPNREKGRILRSFVLFDYLYKEEEPKIRKNENCCLCNNIFNNLDFYIQEVKKKLNDYEYKTFLIGSKIPEELVSKEEEFWEENGVDFCEAIKSSFNREVGYNLRKQTKKYIDFENPDIMVVIDVEKNKIDLQISPLYIEGGYKKNTTKGKVQKIIENILIKKSLASELIFYSIGRLEQNVKTSCYRPFVIMLRNPKKRKIGLKKIRLEVNKLKSVSVSNLSYSDRESLEKMKNEKITASYLVTLEFSRKFKKEEIKETRKKLTDLRNRRVLQFLKKKTRKPYIKRLGVKIKGKSLIIDVESTVGFSINSFLRGKSKPNLKKLIGRDFKIKEIILKKYRKMKTHEMYS